MDYPRQKALLHLFETIEQLCASGRRLTEHDKVLEDFVNIEEICKKNINICTAKVQRYEHRKENQCSTE